MRRRWTLNWAAALILSLAIATIALPSRQAAASPSAKQDSVSAMAASSFSLATASAPTTSLPDAPVEAPLKELTDSGVTKPIDEVFSRIAGGDQVSWLGMVKGIFAGKGLDFRALFGAFGRGIASDLLINSKVLGRIILIGVVNRVFWTCSPIPYAPGGLQQDRRLGVPPALVNPGHNVLQGSAGHFPGRPGYREDRVLCVHPVHLRACPLSPARR